MNVEDALQMCSAPSLDFTGGEWCYAANTLAEEVARLREELAGKQQAAEAEIARLREERDAALQRVASNHDDVRKASEGAEAAYRERDALIRDRERWRLEWQAGVKAAEARCARLQQALRELRAKVVPSLIAVKGHLETPYVDDERWTPWSRFVEPCLYRFDEVLNEALAGPDTLTAGEPGVEPDGTARVAPADGCAERQSTADPSPAASVRLRQALAHALDCKGSYNGTVSENGGHPAICQKCAAEAREALAGPDTPADSQPEEPS